MTPAEKPAGERNAVDLESLGEYDEAEKIREQVKLCERVLEIFRRQDEADKTKKTMHYRNGREAKNGDQIVQLGSDGKIVAFGVLHSATPGNDYCNGSIAPVHGPTGACMCDCLHIEDVAELLKEKNLHERPKGK